MDRETLKRDLTRCIPRQWRGDIKIESIEILSEANGRPAGTVVAQISSRSRLGCEQAMLSLGGHFGNDLSQWDDGWQRSSDRWFFTGYEPTADAQQQTILEAATQFEESATPNS